ncbi:hypothetical protein [Roseovarius nanhaiticus]|uniref:hypothetical protein n=1 Tax=Roseovarius nanhaiticus TaxID=573024 RepID=UPI00248F8301|nr:hypothetical protein [Roseovarius nanhaiticus]
MRIRSTIAGCGLALLAAAQGFAQDGTTSLTADLTLTDPASGQSMQPADGQMVQLDLTLTDAVTGQPPRGVPLQGWVRPVQTGNSSCEQAVRGFLTTGAVPTGSVNLNTSVLAMLSRDGSVGVIHPKLNLMSANMLAAFKLDEQPAGIVIDTAQMRVLATQGTLGQVMALPVPGGDAVVLATGLASPDGIAVTEDGDIWVTSSENGTLSRLAPDGTLRSSTELGAARVDLRDELDVPIVVFSDTGAIRLIDRTNGQTITDLGPQSPLSDVAAIGDIGLLSLPAGRSVAQVRYLDAVDVPIDIPLGLPFSRVSVSLDGRFALAWTPGEGTFVLIDLARAQVVQPVALRDATITEARIFNDAAYLLSHDGGFVGVIDLDTVDIGRAAEITEVRLGVKGDRPQGETALLLPLAPSPQLLAVDPVTQTGFVIEAMSGVNGMPPMDATRLRGGVPQKVLVVDRRLEETAPGQFSVTWAFPAGEYELMLTTGITGLSSCLRFEVQGIRQANGVMPVRMEVLKGSKPILAGEPHDMKLKFYGPEGELIKMPRTPILVPGFKSGWRTKVMAVPQSDGALAFQITLPHAGTFAVQPMQLPAHLGLRSAVLIEAVTQGD